MKKDGCASTHTHAWKRNRTKNKHCEAGWIYYGALDPFLYLASSGAPEWLACPNKGRSYRHLFALSSQGRWSCFWQKKIETDHEKQAEKETHIVIIDGTWQEAQKILNKSPYLQSLPRLEIQTDVLSQFTLRRNQKPGHLCTSEAIAKALRQVNEEQASEKLDTLTSLYLKTMKMVAVDTD